MPADVVLVAHHDERVREEARAALGSEGLLIDEASDWLGALHEVARVQPAVLVVAARFAGTDVLARITEPRDAGALGVLVLTAHEDADARRSALDAGADDYVSEATIETDLAPRVRALLRRIAPRITRRLEFGDLVIDLAAREVHVGDDTIDLTSREFDLLAFLAGEPRTVFTRSELLESVWGVSAEWQSVATVTEHMRRLRLKLEGSPNGVRWLRTVRGVGYAFRP